MTTFGWPSVLRVPGPRSSALLLVTAVLLAYANALPNGFVWDDFDLIVHQPYFGRPGGLAEIFRTDPFGYPLSLGQYYRPIQTLTFWFQHQLHGDAPFPYHLANVLLHAANVLLGWALLRRLAFGAGSALLASLAFALHPLGVECVAFIAVRGDLLVFGFGLLALHAFLGLAPVGGGRSPSRARTSSAGPGREAANVAGHTAARTAVRVTLVGLCVAFALLTKESGVVVPLLLVLLAWARRPLGRAAFAALVLAFAVAGAYVGVRFFTHLGSVASEVLSAIGEASVFQRFLTAFRILATDLRLLLLPIRLHVEYQFVVRSVASPWVWLGGPLAFGALGVLFWRARRADRRLGVVFVAWFLVGIAPFFHVWPLAQTLAERWLYLPGFGFMAALVLAVRSLVDVDRGPASPAVRTAARAGARGDEMSLRAAVRTALLALALVWIAFLGVQTHLRNRAWRDAETLFGGDLVRAGESFLVPHNYGVALFLRGETARARELFELAIARAPGRGYGTAHNSLGGALELSGDLAGAEREYAKAIRVSRYPLAFSNRARVLLMLGRPEEARRIAEDGLRSYPQHLELHHALGQARAALGDWAGAAAAWERIPAGAAGFGDVPALLAEARRRSGSPSGAGAH